MGASGSFRPFPPVTHGVAMCTQVCRTGMAALTGSDGPFDCGDEPYMMHSWPHKQSGTSEIHGDLATEAK